jgi:NAD+ synthase (glutamine-hydrolysing)
VHFSDIGQDPSVHDVTYENSQARERTQILMDIANKKNALVIGTGDLSELALGWATYNGDHMSMYGVNAGIPKTLVKHLVQWVAENGMDEASKATLLDIVDTPISPELIPADEKSNKKRKTSSVLTNYTTSSCIISYGSASARQKSTSWHKLHSVEFMMMKQSKNGCKLSSAASLTSSLNALACRTDRK